MFTDNVFAKRDGWELDHTGGGNFQFIRDFKTKNGEVVCVMVSELGAAIPQHDDETFKTMEEYKEDFTYEYEDLIEYVDWTDEEAHYVKKEKIFEFFNDDQIKEIMETCEQLDLFYGY